MTMHDAGLAESAALLIDTASPSAFDQLAVGTGTGAIDSTDTALGTEITDSGLARAAGTKSRVTTSVTNDTAQLSKAFSVTGSKTIGECASFNATSAGDMWFRQLISPTRSVVNGDTFTLTAKVQCS